MGVLGWLSLQFLWVFRPTGLVPGQPLLSWPLPSALCPVLILNSVGTQDGIWSLPRVNSVTDFVDEGSWGTEEGNTGNTHFSGRDLEP